MSAMPVTASLPPTPPSYLNVWSEELCAQTELFPLRVIIALNRWGLGRESLEDAGRESQHAETALKKSRRNSLNYINSLQNYF